MCFEQEKK